MDWPVSRTRSRKIGLGTPLPCFAVAAGFGRDRREFIVASGPLKTIDRVISRQVVGEDLGEEEILGNPKGVDAPSPNMAKAPTHRLDRGERQGVEERKPNLWRPVVANGLKLVARRGAVADLTAETSFARGWMACMHHQFTDPERHQSHQKTNEPKHLICQWLSLSECYSLPAPS